MRPSAPALVLPLFIAVSLTVLAVIGTALIGIIAGVAVAGALAFAWMVLARPRFTLALWVIAGPILAGPISALFPSDAFALTPDRLLAGGLGAVAMIGWLAGRSASLDRMEYLWLIFAGICLASMVMTGGSPPLIGGMRADITFLVLGYGLPAIGYFVARRLAGDEDGARAVLWAMTITGALLAITGILQLATGTTAFQSDRYQGTTEDRALGTVSSPGEYGLLVLTGSCAAVVLMLRQTGAMRVAVAGSLMLMAVALVLAKTRAFWLCGVIVAPVLAWRIPALRRGLVLGGGSLVALAIIVVPFVVDTTSLAKRMTELTPLYNRVALSSTAFNGALHHPIAGVGFARHSFLEHKVDYLTSTLGVPTYWAMAGVDVPHCEILHLLFMVGLLGAVPWLLAWAQAIRLAKDAPHGNNLESDLAAVVLAGAITFLITGLTLDTGLLYFGSFQMWVMVGVLAGMRDQRLRV